MEEVLALTEDNICALLAKKINQVFYVAADGSAAIPIANQPTTGSEKGTWYRKMVDDLIAEIERNYPKDTSRFHVN